MNEQLQRAYDALQQADAAGNAEDAQQLADYIRALCTPVFQFDWQKN